MMRRLALLIIPVLLGCQCRGPEPLRPEAAAIFARADLPGAGGSLVVDVDELRRLGVVRDDAQAGSVVADALMHLLPSLAVELKDEEAGPVLARATVLIGLARAWADWPKVRQVALLLPWRPGGADDLSLASAIDGATLVMAVSGDKTSNDKLLGGLSALDRAGGEPWLKADGEAWCGPALGELGELCARAGDGYFALSTASGLKALVPSTPVTPTARPAHMVLRARLEVPLLMKAQVTVTADRELKGQVVMQAQDAQLARSLEQETQAFLGRLDTHRQETRAVLAPALARTQAALATDGSAPRTLRELAAATTVDRLLDPSGHVRLLRESITVRRMESEVTVEAAVPETLMRQLKQDASGLTGLMLAGALTGSIAPQLTEYRCRARQHEVDGNLRALVAAQRGYREQHGTWASQLSELEGFKPAGTTGYTYCLSGGCLACTRPGCDQSNTDSNPCLRQLDTPGGDSDGVALGPPACAFGYPDSADNVDLWLAGPDGEPLQLQDGCQ